MDDRLIYAIVGGGVIYALHLLERRLASFENRIVVGLNAQTSLMRETAIVEYEMEIGEDDEDEEDFLK